MKKKQYYKSFFILSVIISLVASCNPEDGEDGAMGIQGEQGIQGPAGENTTITTPAAYGLWEVTSETGTDVVKYVYINEDNTLNILSEDLLGFKRTESTNITVSENQLITNSYQTGLSGINNYVANDDILTITRPNNSNPLVLQRLATAPNSSEWVIELNVLEEGDIPWDRGVDIAFDGTYILGYHSSDNTILQINPNDYSIHGTIPTTRSAYAVEIEKSDDPTRQLFQSSNGSRNFHSYIYSSNDFYYTSLDLGPWVRGIASIMPGELWVSSESTESLYHYKSNGSLVPGEILETIPLNLRPAGLDYRDGYLYVTENNRVHKCQVTPEFKAVESYEIKSHNVTGITYDGTNFWLAAAAWDSDGTYKLLKTDLTL